MLVIFSDFSIWDHNDFLDVFGSSQEVSQEPFGGHLGYLLGQLVGWFSLPPEITNNNKNSTSFCLWALGKANRIMSLCFLICFEGGQSNENIFEKENTMSVAFERFPIAVCTWLHFFDYSGWTTSISIRINVAEEKGGLANRYWDHCSQCVSVSPVGAHFPTPYGTPQFIAKVVLHI